MSKPVLKNLLREGIRFSPLYKPVYNSDHLPMALAAMHGLGASDDQLVKFRDDYVQRLQSWEPAGATDDWTTKLGDRSAYPALLAYFNRQLDSRQQQDVIEEVLATTLPGIALDAFHPIIRLGYAVEFDTREEIAAALAYMVTAHRDMPVDMSLLDVRSLLDQQVRHGALALKANRFTGALEELVETGLYPTGSTESFAELATVALDVYIATRNFFALHLVTSTQALRCAVPPALEPIAVASQTSALLASHLILKSPAIGSAMSVPDQLDPEHAIKYAWSCLSEYRVYGDGRYIDEIRTFRDKGLVPPWVAADLLDQTH